MPTRLHIRELQEIDLNNIFYMVSLKFLLTIIFCFLRKILIAL